MSTNYKALVVNNNDGAFSLDIKTLNTRQLKAGEVLIEVRYSGINYKDCLACSENGNITKTYPHIPGIDLSGIVISSKDDRYNSGDYVIATSYTIGVSDEGGFSERCIVNGDYIVPLPSSLTLKDAMIYGTAGLTAAKAIRKLELNGLKRNNETVLVTGATGGVGSHAVAMLATLGYNVIAISRKANAEDYLKKIGASQVLSYDDLRLDNIKSLDKQQWDGAIDVVGGHVLASIISKLKYGSSVASCGLTGGTKVNTTVFPFILRDINLLGIDSVFIPLKERIELWTFIAQLNKSIDCNSFILKEIDLADIPYAVQTTLQGKNIGRYLIALNK